MTTYRLTTSLIVGLVMSGSMAAGTIAPPSPQNTSFLILPPVESDVLSTEVYPWQNPDNALDVNHDAVVSPLDALLIVNEVNSPRWSNPETGWLPRLSLPADPIYFDVSGNNLVSFADAMLVMEHLNLQARPIHAVPEPSAAVLGMLGVVGLVVRRRATRRTGISGGQG